MAPAAVEQIGAAELYPRLFPEPTLHPAFMPEGREVMRFTPMAESDLRSLSFLRQHDAPFALESPLA